MLQCRARRIYRIRTQHGERRIYCLICTIPIAHCFFVKVFLSPLIIFPNHIKFMTPSTAGTVKTRKKPKMCICFTCQPNQVTFKSSDQIYYTFLQSALAVETNSSENLLWGATRSSGTIPKPEGDKKNQYKFHQYKYSNKGKNPRISQFLCL